MCGNVIALTLGRLHSTTTGVWLGLDVVVRGTNRPLEATKNYVHRLHTSCGRREKKKNKKVIIFNPTTILRTRFLSVCGFYRQRALIIRGIRFVKSARVYEIIIIVGANVCYFFKISRDKPSIPFLIRRAGDR